MSPLMHLYKVIFATTFGRNKHATFSSAVVRIGLLAIASGGLGLLLARMLPPLQSTPGTTLAFFCSGVFITQLTVFGALAAACGLVRPAHNDVLARLLLYLPVKRLQAWSILLLPGVTILSLALCFLAPSYFSLLRQLEMSWPLCAASFLLGATSALGWVYGFPRRLGWLQGIGILGTLSLEYWLLRQTYTHSSGLEICGWALTIILAEALVIRSSFRMPQEAGIPQKHRTLIGRRVPAGLWFFKKLCRNFTTRIGIVVTICLSMIISMTFWRLSFWDPGLIGAVSALLSSALAADVRSLCVRIRPIEIVGLQGVFRFSGQQFWATICICVLAVCPIIGMTITQLGLMHLVATFRELVPPTLLGISCGLFSSVLFAPGPRDVTAQAAATLLATGIFLLPQLSIFSQLTETVLFIIRVTLTLLLLTLAVFTEYKRNPFIWRNRNDTTC
jgi:hypothetical protein